MKGKPQAPAHLRPETREWWQYTSDEFACERHHLRLLTLAAEAWDMIVMSREVVEKDGAFHTDHRGRILPHPGLAVQDRNRTLFARLLRELALDASTPTEDHSRPPRLVPMKGAR
jgi:phage terminase small subunit